MQSYIFYCFAKRATAGGHHRVVGSHHIEFDDCDVQVIWLFFSLRAASPNGVLYARTLILYAKSRYLTMTGREILQ